jgi:hypothetical protein
VKRLVVVGLVMATSVACRNWDEALANAEDAGAADGGNTLDAGHDGGADAGPAGDGGEPVTLADTSAFPDAGAVISLFGSTYPATSTTIAWDESFTVGFSEVTDVMISNGHALKRYDLHHYASIGIPARVDATAMNFLHVDLWFVTAPPVIEIQMVQFDSRPSPAVSKFFQTPLGDRSWLSLDLPLANFQPAPNPRTGIGQILLLCEDQSHTITPPTEHHVVFLDNLFLHQ